MYPGKCVVIDGFLGVVIEVHEDFGVVLVDVGGEQKLVAISDLV